METKFTTKSQEALSAASANASTAGNPQVEPAHVLKALMDQRDGVAVAVLKAAGADPDEVSAQASAAIKALPSATGSATAQAQFNRGALQVLQAAEQFAQSLGDEYISTEHLLYGLAQQEGRVGDILRGAGAGPDQL